MFLQFQPRIKDGKEHQLNLTCQANGRRAAAPAGGWLPDRMLELGAASPGGRAELKRLMLSSVSPIMRFACLRSSRRTGENLPGSVIDPLLQTSYVREEAGTHRYNVGTDTPKLCATSCGGVPLANSFLAA